MMPPPQKKLPQNVGFSGAGSYSQGVSSSKNNLHIYPRAATGATVRAVEIHLKNPIGAHSSAASRNNDSSGQHPELASRNVPVFPPLGSDRCEAPIEYVPEYLARKLITDRIGTFVRLTKHLSGVRLFATPPPRSDKAVSLRGGSFDRVTDADSIDNARGCWSYDGDPVMESFVDPRGRRRRRRIPATIATYKTYPTWVRDNVFRRVLLDCITGAPEPEEDLAA